MKCKICGYNLGNETVCPFSVESMGESLSVDDSKLMAEGKLSDAEHHLKMARWILHNRRQQPMELITWSRQIIHAAQGQGWG